MAKFFLKYNPYKVESVMQSNGREISEDSKLHSFKNERLQVWLDRLIPILNDECNDNILDITFHGTQLDYEDLKGTIANWPEKKLTITCTHLPAQGTDDKFQELIGLFNEMQEGPFEDLKDQHIKENFQKALSSEFEVSVIATMSSGKSTLINSLLGQELMPAKQEACTATIARIKDTDGLADFTGECKNQEGEIVYESQKVNLEKMKLFNEDEKVSYIDIEGDIPFIQSRKVDLVLVDTPGPNNSRNQDHRDQTYRIIKNNAKPMVLYVLNATQLATDDDSVLLGSVADAMKVGGKQSKDRFIFAVNKIDEYDTEKADSIDEALHNIRNYLAKYGIENPNIYPTSAEMAKVIRMHQNGLELTKKQGKTLEDYDLFNDVPEMHLVQYTPLREVSKRKLGDRVLKARETNDHYDEALIHSGIPAIEEAINDYLNKYALTTKIKTAVDTFKKKVEEKRMLDELFREIEQNLEEKQRINQQLERVELQLNEGKSTEKFKTKIQNLSFDKETEDNVKEIKSKVDSMLRGYTEKKMTRVEMEQHMTKFIRKIQNLQSDVVTELEKMVNDGLRKDAEMLIAEYSAYIQSLMKDNAVSMQKFDLNSGKFILGDLPDATNLIDKHKKTEKEKIGEEAYKNPAREGFFGFFKIWAPWELTRAIYEEREYVDASKVFDEFIKPIRGEFYENVSKARQHMQEESSRLKAYFIQELDKLDAVIKKKIVELKDLTGDSHKLEDRIQKDRTKMEWLNAFLTKLDTILDI